MAQLRLTGFLYWDLNAWENRVTKGGFTAPLSHTPIDGASLTSPFIDPGAWQPWQSQPHDVGDGKLTYAGKDGPIGSIRLHAIRDGIEDFGYLALLKAKKGDAAVQQLLAKISDPSNLQKHIGLDAATRGADLKLLMAQRREIAKVLSG